MPGTDFTPGEHPVFASHGDGFEVVLHIREKEAHLLLMIGDIGECPGEWVAVDQVNALAQIKAPVKEGVCQRFALLGP